MRAPELSDLLPMYEQGSLQGVDLDEQGAAAMVAARYGAKQPWCLVRGWIILNVEGERPLLYAQWVVRHSAGRFAPTQWVRSSPAIEEPDLGVFRTRSTVYVLQGAGSALTIAPEDLATIF